MNIYQIVEIHTSDAYYNSKYTKVGTYIYTDEDTYPVIESGWWMHGPFCHYGNGSSGYALRIRVRPIVTPTQLKRMKLEMLL